MTDHTAHHYDNATTLLDLATEAIDAANTYDVTVPGADPTTPAELRIDARDALAGAAVHAALAQTAALRDIALLLRSGATGLASAYQPLVAAVLDAVRPQPSEPVEAVLEVTEPTVPQYVTDAAERIRVLGLGAVADSDLGLVLGFVAGLSA